MNDQFYVPRTLDAPAKLIFWEADEIAICVACFIAGILAGHFFIGLTIGLLAMIGYSKAKKGRGGAYVKQSAYWYLPSNLFFKLRRTPPSHIREYVG